jgi:alpha-2-macroglobulin-like protein
MSQANEHVLAEVDDFLHGLLTPERAAHVERHCADCPDCARALGQARRRLEALRAVPPTEAPARLVRATVDRIGAYEQRRRQRRRRLFWVGGVALAACVLVLAGLHLHLANLKASPTELIVLGQNKLLSSTLASLRVRVVDRDHNTALAGVPVSVELHSRDGRVTELASFTTDPAGSGNPRFRLPDWADGTYQLRVVAKTRGGPDVLTKEVQLRRSWKLMLSSDKPVYQPGQTIRLRALALRRPDLRPVADEPAVFRVADPKGNVIYKKDQPTSAFGITFADCDLASEVLEGAYTVSCKVGDTESKLAVEVKKYTLPKFKVDVKFDRPFYSPRTKVRCKVKAGYFFGKPVTDAEVEVRVSASDVTRKPFEPLKARTDAKGRAEVTFSIPDPLAGRPQDSGDARLSFQVTVTDSAGQKVTRSAERLVTTRPVRVEVIPESGTLVRGVANTVYLLVTKADGTPVPGARVSVNDEPGGPRTDDRGAASFSFTPDSADVSWVVKVMDAGGNALARERARLKCGDFPLDFLLRTDRAVYKAGQTMTLTALGGGAEPVFVDLIKDGQTLLTETVEVSGGRGTLSVDLPADLFGTVQLVAYRLNATGLPVRKKRVLYVKPADGGKITATLDRAEYRPGREAKLNLSLRDAQGKPVPGALSLAAVDEAVFNVLPQRPGTEQTFYMLEEELLKPVYAIYSSWSPERADGAQRLDRAVLAKTAQGEAKRSSEGITGSVIHSLAVTSFPEKVQQVARARQEGLHYVRIAWLILLGLTAGAIYAGLWCYLSLADVLKVHAVALAFLVPLAFLTSMVLIWGRSGSLGGNNVALTSAGADRMAAQNEAAPMPKAAFGGEPKTPGFLPPTSDRGPAVGKDWGAPDAAPPPRVREAFPETMLWRPQLVTDDDGRASLDIALADSITTWRLSASAVTAGGQLGSAQLPLKVFQPFFVDLNLPVSLTRGDEVSVPVVVYSYLDKPQTVTLTLADGKWFTLLGDARQTLELKPGEVRALHYRLKVRQVGEHHLQVTAIGGKVSDAIKRTIEVVPDGRRVEHAFSGTLDRPAEVKLDVPAGAIDGSVKAFLKVYPSSFSQLVEGLDNIFRMPSGCFEQTSSTTYPNVLALDYLRRNKLSVPRVEAKARQFIHLGYQRLVGFEVQGGGFDWFGRPPANTTLTAYGLMEFEDMARVHDVDPELIQRTRKWLLDRRRPDGSWEPEGHALHEDVTRTSSEQRRLATTAYVAWAVFAGGKAANESTKTLDYLLTHPPAKITDPHVLALVCNALLALDPNRREAGPYLDRLESLKKTEGDKHAYWEQPAGERTTFYGAGPSGRIETTALAALALLQGGKHPGTARGALAWLVAQKDPHGTWHSTQATVLSLKALLAGTGKPLGKDGTRRIEARLGKHVERIVIPADQAEVLKQVDLSKYLGPGAQRLTLTETTDSAAGYQVSFRYHLPEPKAAGKEGPLAITLSYDRTTLTEGDAVEVRARVGNKMKQPAAMVMLDLPVPGGFAPVAEDFARLVETKTIARFQARRRQVLVYLRDLPAGKALELTYRLRATMPVKVSAPGARAYEYYDPQKEGRSQGVKLEVRGRE